MPSGGLIRSGRAMCSRPNVMPLSAPESLVQAADLMLSACATRPAARRTNGGKSDEEILNQLGGISAGMI
jgi:hypothetical protein